MKVQSDIFTIIGLTILLVIIMIIITNKLNKAEPLAKPKGIILPALIGIEKLYGSVKENVGEKNAQVFTPYIIILSVYIFLSNILSLFGVSSPTANWSVTLTLAIISWTITQLASFKYSGVKNWFLSFLDPIPILLPINILGKFTIIISMSLRLFGNILCGGIMMQLVYNFAQVLSNTVANWFGNTTGVFNFLGPIIAPILHLYFDLFAGFIQTLVFVTLTMVLIGNDIPDEAKKA